MATLASGGDGIFVEGVSITSTSGNISLTGIGGIGDSGQSDGISNIITDITSNSGNISLIADEIGFEVFSNVTISSTGSLLIQPVTPSLDINIGGSGSTPALDLSTEKLGILEDGFTSITIGRADGSGTITFADDVTFNDPVTLRSPLGAGSIDTAGFTLTGADDATITLLAAGNITTGNITNPGRSITIGSPLLPAASIQAGSITTNTTIDGENGGSVFLQAIGNITANEIITVWQGTTTGDGGQITVNAGGNIEISGDGIISFTQNGNGGSITLDAGDNIYTDDIQSIGTLSSGDISLTSGGTIDTTFFGGTPGAILSCSGSQNECSGGSGRGGNVTLEATNSIITSINANGVLGGGNIVVSSDEIDIRATSDGGTLVLQPKTTSQNLVIGGSANDTGALDLTATELGELANGFISITIGRTDGTGIITLNPATFNDPVNIIGGSTLVGANVDTTFTITSTDTGNVSGFPNGLTFSSIENLFGGSANDTFAFTNNTTLSGTIDGGIGTDTLDYSINSTPVTVNLAALGAQNMEAAIGNAGSTLVGTNTANTWNITSNNSGTVNNILNFSTFSNLTGGNLEDTFIFNNRASISGNINGATGNLILQGDELNFAGNISGTGGLTIQPLTSTQAIQIGGTDSGSNSILDLTATKLNLLQNGFTSITIGDASSNGAITLAGNTTFNDPVTLQAPGETGSIDTTGGTLTGADDATITLLANQAITTGDIINLGRQITLTSNSSNISLIGNVAASDVTLNAASAVTQTQQISASGLELLGSGSYTLTHPANDITTLAANTTGAVNYQDSNDFSIGIVNTTLGITTPSQLTLNARNAVTQTQQISASGLELLGSSSYTLTHPANDITTLAANTSGAVNYQDSNDFSIGTVNTTTAITTNGGNVALTSLLGTIDASAETINTSSILGNGGRIDLSANTIKLGNIDTSSIAGSGGDISFIGNVNLTQPNTTITTTGSIEGGGIIFNNALNGTMADAQNLTLNADTGNVTFTGAVGNNTSLGDLRVNSTNNTQFNSSFSALSLATDTGGTTQLNGDVTTTGANGQRYGDDITVVGNINLTSDEIDFGGTVAGTGNLTLQPFTTSQAIAISGTSDTGTSTLDLSASDINALQNGFNSITIGREDSSGALTLDGNTTFSDPVTLRSPIGSISTIGSQLRAQDQATITFNADQIITGDIINPGQSITLNSPNGNIDISGGIIDTSSTTGDGGAIAVIAAGGNIIASSLNSSSTFGAGGQITLAAFGEINTANINANGKTIGGNINLSAASDINTGEIQSQGNLAGGTITITSGGDLNINNTLVATLDNGRGGDVTLKADGNLNTGNILASGFLGNGGNINLESGGAINTTFGSLAGALISNSAFGRGGNITLKAGDRITTGPINTLSFLGDGGNVD
jgi:hypothetical protein